MLSRHASRVRCRLQLPDAGEEQIDKPRERVFEVVWVGMTITRLEVGKAVERASQGPSDVDPLRVVEVEAAEGPCDDCDDLFDCIFEFGITGTGVTVGRCIEPRRVAHDPPPCVTERLHDVGPGHALGCRAESIGEKLAAPEPEASDQVVEALDVSVQRRLPNTKPIGDTGECDRIETFGIGNASSLVDDLFGIERRSHHELEAITDRLDQTDLVASHSAPPDDLDRLTPEIHVSPRPAVTRSPPH